MAKFIQVVLSKIARGILNDPVYKDFYVVKSNLKNGDCVLSPVMDHSNFMIYESGLRTKTVSGEISDFVTLGRGSEEDMLELLDAEKDTLTKSFQ